MAFKDPMEEHLSKLGAIAKELDVIGIAILDDIKVIMFLMSLPQSYEYLVTFLEFLESFDPKKLTWETIEIRLLNEELMIMEKNKSLETMFSTEITLLFKKSSAQKHKDKSENVCNYCKQKVHWAKECEKRKNEYAKRKTKLLSIVKSSNKDGEAFIYALATFCEANAWYVNFGTSSHFSHCKKRFKTYESISLVKIYIGDNSTQDTIRKTNIEFMMTVGDTTIKGVFNILHIPGITKKIFFVNKTTTLNHVLN
jgi:hypothetical protein